MRTLIVALAVLAVAHAAQSNGIAQADLLIDFGEAEFVNEMPNPSYNPTPSPVPFMGKHLNNVWCDPTSGGANAVAHTTIVDTTGGALPGVSVTTQYFVTDGWKGPNDGISTAYPDTAEVDALGCKHLDPSGLVTISGLTEAEYTVRLFSSTHEEKAWYNDNARRTDFTVGGVTKMVHCSGNLDYVESFYNVAPVGGTIVVEVTGAIPGGEETYSYGYINVLELVVPEPATLSLLALGGLVAIRRRR